MPGCAAACLVWAIAGSLINSRWINELTSRYIVELPVARRLPHFTRLPAAAMKQSICLWHRSTRRRALCRSQRRLVLMMRRKVSSSKTASEWSIVNPSGAGLRILSKSIGYNEMPYRVSNIERVRVVVSSSNKTWGGIPQYLYTKQQLHTTADKQSQRPKVEQPGTRHHCWGFVAACP